MVIPFAIISIAQEAIDAGKTPSVWWQLLAYVIITSAEILISIVCLEFSYTQSPRKMKSFIMGIFLVSVTLGNLFTGAVNLYIQIPSIEIKKDTPHAGYDGKLGTLDDLHSEEKGKIISASTPQIDKAISQVESYFSQQNYLPDSSKGNELIKDLKDSWGNPLSYRLINAKSARVLTMGPDEKEKTKWDLGVIINIKDTKEEEKDTWLHREKLKKGLIKVTQHEKQETPLEYNYFAGGQLRLEGSAYFWFFTILMLVTAVIFIPFSMVYKTKTYLQE